MEGGFETGLLQGTEIREEKVTTGKNVYEDYLPLNTILKGATNLFGNAQAISQLQFSSLHPVKVSVSGANLVVENFLPYNLNNVKLSFKDSQGKLIDLGMIETIPKQAKIVIPEKLFDNFKDITPNATYQSFEVSSTKFSDVNTQRLFKVLDTMTTDLVVEYKSPPTFDSCQYHTQAGHNTCYSPFNAKTAEEFTNLLLNMYAVLDSKSWQENIKNAPFDFVNSWHPGDCHFKASDCVAPGKNGQVESKFQKDVVSPEKVIADFRSTMHLEVSVLNNAGVDGIGLGQVTWGKLGVVAWALDPKTLFGAGYKHINLTALRTILHEFSHTKHYSHNGNMTYQRVPKPDGTGDSDGIPYDVCSRFGHKGQPTYPGDFQGSVYPNCANVPAGFTGLTMAVWQQLINQNALPIDYADLGSQKDYKLHASLNTSDLANSMLSTLKQSFLVASAQTITNDVSKNFKTPMLGFNFKMGYQHYFNNFIGLAYYGIVKYNYAKANNEKIQQLSLGIGTDLLLDFVTTYTKASKDSKKKSFSSSFGMFVGVRGLYNGYHVFNQVQRAKNVDATTGLNYRYKHSKYSVGISVPLIERKVSIVSNSSVYNAAISLNEKANDFNVFFNYGWVF
ncbi:porin family protein [Helicobacter cetorum]|uniref:hypothetical protein n=1 Tax=Helicobacter cetorum TaxID=138563 RepID=UPI00068032E2|nr:hypothetical protein [Helicobacter cetorum]